MDFLRNKQIYSIGIYGSECWVLEKYNTSADLSCIVFSEIALNFPIKGKKILLGINRDFCVKIFLSQKTWCHIVMRKKER